MNKLIGEVRRDLDEMEIECMDQMEQLLYDLKEDKDQKLYRGFSINNLN